MEELKLLIEMVSNLPSMVLWVLVGFWAYKMFVVGSIYGVIRFCVSKLVEWKTRPITYTFHGMYFSESVGLQLASVLRNGCKGVLNQLDTKDIVWLDQAIREKQKREQEEING